MSERTPEMDEAIARLRHEYERWRGLFAKAQLVPSGDEKLSVRYADVGGVLAALDAVTAGDEGVG